MYNEKRLHEVPIPVISNDDEVCQLVTSSSEAVLEQTETSFDPNRTESENSVATTSNNNDSIDENISSSDLSNEFEVTTNQVFLEECTNGLEISQDQSEIDPLIKQEPESHLDDDDQNIFDNILSTSSEFDSQGDNGNDPVTSENQSDDDERFLDADKIEKFPMPMTAFNEKVT